MTLHFNIYSLPINVTKLSLLELDKDYIENLLKKGEG